MNVLAIGAHFDDIELGCAGALMKHVDEGDKVTMLVVTDTEYRNYDGTLLRNKKEALSEGKVAAEIIGAKLVCGNLKTKRLTHSWRLIEFLNKWIDHLGIKLIYTHWDRDVHQDHFAVGKATLAAGRHVPRILIYQSNWYQTTTAFQGTFYVDISKYIGRKVAAVKAHQIEYRMRGDSWVQFFKNIDANYGQKVGVRYAECFAVIKYLK
ncbi:MAG: PIG-L family deacetylase [Candidatus Omnitrophica bacterium]|nr:PIG-L family deacetylase [Candidatus Omnitrophota bacterium]